MSCDDCLAQAASDQPSSPRPSGWTRSCTQLLVDEPVVFHNQPMWLGQGDIVRVDYLHMRVPYNILVMGANFISGCKGTQNLANHQSLDI